MGTTPILAAALAGIPTGIQRQGVWSGHRQLFIRFAGAAETAQMYTADALARELNRALTRSPYHSVCACGRDALGNADYLAATLRQLPRGQRVMIDTDGQRPEAVAVVREYIQLLQVTVDTPVTAVAMENVQATLRAADRVGLEHAVVVSGSDDASDADYLQIVEQTHAASERAIMVFHPGPTAERGPLDRRWGILLEHALGKHGNVRIALRLSGPMTMR